jgi:glycosyltransferase involved in cell wall biosynthesis
MKVLHVIPSLSPALGGPPQVAMRLVHALRQAGVDAEIVTTNHNGAEPLEVPLFERVLYTPERSLSVPVWFLPHARPALKEFIFSTALTRWLWQNLDRYDVLDHHYLFSYAPTCAGVIARHKNIPYTVRTMGQLTPWALAQSKAKKQLYTALIERHNLERASIIHCTTDAEAEDVRCFGITTPTLTLPLGVERSPVYPGAQARVRTKYGVAENIPIVLFLSRLHYKKRPDLLLQSLGKLKAAGLSFHLILAGSGQADYLKQLEQRVVALGLEQQVSFAGLVSGEDKDILLQGSSAFVLPSFSENFGIAVAEALVAGLPVVITPGIQIATEIGNAEAGLIVESEIDAVAGAIAQLLHSPGLRQKLGQNGKKLAESRYSWGAIAQDLALAYEKIVSN